MSGCSSIGIIQMRFGRMPKHKVIFAIVFAVIVFFGLYLFFLRNDKKDVIASLDAYINAVKN